MAPKTAAEPGGGPLLSLYAPDGAKRTERMSGIVDAPGVEFVLTCVLAKHTSNYNHHHHHCHYDLDYYCDHHSMV